MDNPFYIYSVASMEDKRDIPEFASYSQKAKEYLEAILKKYAENKLPCTIIPITGQTGTGKTFLLRQLSRQAYKQILDNPHSPGNLFIPIAPVDILQCEISTENVAKTIWENITKFLHKEKNGYRPIDFYAYKIIEEMRKKIKEGENEIKLGSFFWGKKLSREDFKSIDSFNELTKNYSAKIWKIFQKTESHNKNYTSICRWTITQAFNIEFISSFEKSSFIDKIGQFTYMSRCLKLMPVLVFDQFEDLEMVGEDLNKQIYHFILKIFDLERSIKKDLPEKLAVPMFLLSLFNDIALTKHLKDRLFTLPNGKITIALEKLVLADFAKAQEFSNYYFDKYCKDSSEKHVLKKQWDNLQKKLQEQHANLKKEKSITPRAWIKCCYEVWENRDLIVLQKPEPKNEPKSEPPKPEPPKPEPPKPEPPKPEPPIIEIVMVDDLPQYKDFYSQVISILKRLEIEENYLEVLEKFISSLSCIEKSKFTLGSIDLPKEPKEPKDLKFEINGIKAVLTVSTKSNKGGGCRKDWNDFQKRMVNENYQYLFFLRAIDFSFPPSIGDTISDKKIVKKIMKTKDWAFVFYILWVTGDSLLKTSPFDSLSRCKLPKNSENIHKILARWELTAPFMKEIK